MVIDYSPITRYVNVATVLANHPHSRNYGMEPTTTLTMEFLSPYAALL